MIACNICDIKLFTKKLFIGETFDRFLLKEAEIVTFNTFSIDGRVHKSFYSEEERAEGQIEEYSTWKTLRPFCFSLIKGKKLPERFSIILKLPKAATEQFLTARKSQWLPEQVGGLFLNIHYENQHLSCVTGLSLNQFTLDKTLEREWDESIRTFLRKEELPFEEQRKPCFIGFSSYTSSINSPRESVHCHSMPVRSFQYSSWIPVRSVFPVHS